jgi:hypothetical protein
MPLAFLAAGAVGASLHLAGVDLPGAEIAVALSVLALGGLILWRRTLPALRLAALFAAAGLFHGHALAESIVGAEPAPLAAYFVGLVAVQYAIALAAMLAARWIAAERPALSRPAATAAGIAIAARRPRRARPARASWATVSGNLTACRQCSPLAGGGTTVQQSDRRAEPRNPELLWGKAIFKDVAKDCVINDLSTSARGCG